MRWGDQSASRSAQMFRPSAPRRAWLALIPLVVGCGANHRQNAPATHPTKSVDRIEAAHAFQPPPLPITDPVLDLIAASEHHFEAGQSELGVGHFEAAKREFDKAVSILMESPYGGRTEPRIREHFDRLVDRISAYEVRALAVTPSSTTCRFPSTNGSSPLSSCFKGASTTSSKRA
jgi:hypothetical protein